MHISRCNIALAPKNHTMKAFRWRGGNA